MIHTSGPTGRAESSTGATQRILQGRYVLADVVGHGGMATVYRARDTEVGRTVAVKLLEPHTAREPRFVEQFLAMERRIAGLFHPNLVTIYDAGLDDAGCFVVMEYIPGGNLRDRLERDGPLPAAEVVRLTAEVADALERLHRERIVHGDVKPDNVLLDAEGAAKLVDFGIAHLATTTGVINTGSLNGSVPYLAPEQLTEGQARPASDVYALGLVAYELLCGQPAFWGENWVAVAAQRLARDPDPPSAFRADVPAALEQALLRALERDPARRYASAAEFRTALLAVRAGGAADAAHPAAGFDDAEDEAADRLPDTALPPRALSGGRPAARPAWSGLGLRWPRIPRPSLAAFALTRPGVPGPALADAAATDERPPAGPDLPLAADAPGQRNAPAPRVTVRRFTAQHPPAAATPERVTIRRPVPVQPAPAAPARPAAPEPPEAGAGGEPLVIAPARVVRVRRRPLTAAGSPLAVFRGQRLVTRLLLLDATLVALLIVATVALTLAGPLAPAPRGAEPPEPAAIGRDLPATDAGGPYIVQAPAGAMR